MTDERDIQKYMFRRVGGVALAAVTVASAWFLAVDPVFEEGEKGLRSDNLPKCAARVALKAVFDPHTPLPTGKSLEERGLLDPHPECYRLLGLSPP